MPPFRVSMLSCYRTTEVPRKIVPPKGKTMKKDVSEVKGAGTHIQLIVIPIHVLTAYTDGCCPNALSLSNKATSDPHREFEPIGN